MARGTPHARFSLAVLVGCALSAAASADAERAVTRADKTAITTSYVKLLKLYRSKDARRIRAHTARKGPAHRRALRKLTDKQVVAGVMEIVRMWGNPTAKKIGARATKWKRNKDGSVTVSVVGSLGGAVFYRHPDGVWREWAAPTKR